MWPRGERDGGRGNRIGEEEVKGAVVVRWLLVRERGVGGGL